MKKWMKAIISFALALAMMIPALPVLAADDQVKDRGASLIEDIDYEGNGKVDVEFFGKVVYGKVSVTVKDSAGKTYTATIIDKDSDDLEFKIKNYKAGKKYTFTIKNMKKKGAEKFRKVTGHFKIAGPKECLVEELDYDAVDREVSFEFQGKVEFKNPTVTIKDADGNKISLKIKEYDYEEIEVKLTNKLQKGATYTYTITGVSRKGKNSFKTVKGKFVAK